MWPQPLYRIGSFNGINRTPSSAEGSTCMYLERDILETAGRQTKGPCLWSFIDSPTPQRYSVRFDNVQLLRCFQQNSYRLCASGLSHHAAPGCHQWPGCVGRIWELPRSGEKSTHSSHWVIHSFASWWCQILASCTLGYNCSSYCFYTSNNYWLNTLTSIS